MRAAAVAASIVLCAIVSLSRQRGPGALDTVWAEDGSIFLQTVVADPSPRRWLDAYAGYMHLAPRMLASVAAAVPLDWVPVVLSGGAALAIGAVALIVYAAARPHIPDGRSRAALAGSVLVSPSAGIEVANAAANIHWYLPFAISWIALRTPTGPFDTAASGVVLFVAAASHPFAFLTLPVLGWRLVRGFRSQDVVLTLALLGGLALQASVMLSGAGSRPLNPLAASFSTLAQWYGFHVLETAVFGITLRDALMHAVGTAVSAAATVAILAYLIAPAARAAARHALVPLALAGLHLGFYFVPVVLAVTSPARYAITPILLLYGLIAWGFAHDTSAQRRPRQLCALIFLTLMTIADFSPRNLRAEGPRWSDELSRARGVCEHQRAGTVTLAIPPQGRVQGETPSWTVVVPCDAVSVRRSEIADRDQRFR